MPNPNEQSELDDRRQFMEKCGRFAVVTSPAITALLSTALTSNAIAYSGGRTIEHPEHHEHPEHPEHPSQSHSWWDNTPEKMAPAPVPAPTSTVVNMTADPLTVSSPTIGQP